MAFDANDLSPHEQYVVDRTREGEIADFTPMTGADGVKPSVRAGFLRKLMLGLDPNWVVRTPGVRLKSVRVDGALDLTDCSGAGGAGLPALSLENCDIPDPIDLSHARLARLSLSGSRMRRLQGSDVSVLGEFDLSNVAPLPREPGDETLYVRMRGARVAGDLLARGAKFARAVEAIGEFSHPVDAVLYLQSAEIAGNLLLDEGFEAFGCVWLLGAKIGGTFSAEDSTFLNRSVDAEACAIVAFNAQIEANLLLRGKFKAEGQVSVGAARVRGVVDLEGGSFRNEGGIALNLNNMEMGGECLAGAKITGSFVLQGASISRNLDLRGAEIANPRKKAANAVGSEFDTALDAANLRVGGTALLQGANIKGEVFLADARIEGYLAFGGGRFINSGGWAIRAPNVRVGGNLTLKIEDGGYAPHGNKTVIEGGAKFDRAQIDGAVSWTNLELRGAGPDGAKGPVLSFADATIRGALQARSLSAQQDAHIDLTGASCNALDDDIRAGWGVDRAALALEGFDYQRIDASDRRWRDRLAWLKRSQRDGDRAHFSPQPYTALAQVYARAGRREDARRILLTQHDQRTLTASAGPLTWTLSSLFGVVAGYGFAPIRAARALILFLAIGVIGVLAMNAQGALVRPDGRACGGAIEPALYAVDVALPVIDLGQENLCAPGRAPGAQVFKGVKLGGSDYRLFEGVALWRWAQAIYAILGAILTALAVITFSGVLKPKSDD